MSIYRILNLCLSIMVLSTSFVLPVKARPLTEATNINKERLTEYYNQYIDLLTPTLNIYEDIEIESEYFILLELLKKDGILTAAQNFYPNNNLSVLKLMEWYFLFFKTKEINNMTQSYHENNDLQKKIIIQKFQNKTKSKSAIWRKIDSSYISEIEARKFLNLPQLGDKNQLSRLDGIDLLIEKMKQQKIFDKWRNQLIESQYSSNIVGVLPDISLDKQYIKLNDKPLKGIFVNWMSDLSVMSSAEIDKEIDRMKSYGIRGVSLELRWDKIEPKPGVFKFPKYFDQTLLKLEKKGMYVHLLLSPHYTPDWVFYKYNQDIRMYDINNNPQDEGEYATYSYLSPGVDDQINFQRWSIEYYKKFPNIITFLLGNEQSYGKENDVDYSFWMENEWKSWLNMNSISFIPIPRDYNDKEGRKKWLRFRQDVLNNYYQKVYRELKPIQSRIPISFKFIPYENTSAYAPNYGLNLSPLDLDMDFLATDIYGYTPNVYAQHYSFDKPKIILETNLPGDWEESYMFRYLLINYFHNIPLQSIFAWVKGEFENALLHDDNTPWQKMNSIKHAVEVIMILDMPNLKSESIAIVIPRNGLNLEAKNFNKYQYKLDNLIDFIFERTGKYPRTLWSDDFQKDNLSNFSPTWTIDQLKQFNEIIIIESPYDLNYININIPDTKIYTSPEEYVKSKS